MFGHTVADIDLEDVEFAIRVVRNEVVGPGPVRLTIYDVTGRRVRSLVDEPRSSGEHAVVWHGRDDAGRSVGSGVYLYEFVAGHHRETRRMVLLR